jgi:hypothetical protein
MPITPQHNALKRLAFSRGGGLHKCLPGLGARPFENNVMPVKACRIRALAAGLVDSCATGRTEEPSGRIKGDQTGDAMWTDRIELRKCDFACI